MKKYSCYLLVLFILWVPEVVGQEDHFHVHTEEEAMSFVKRSTVGEITDYIAGELSFFKISDDLKLNLYRQSHRETVDHIIKRRTVFAKNLAKNLKSGKIRSLEEVYQEYRNWIANLEQEIELIPFSKEKTEEEYSLRSREMNGPCENMDFEDGTFNGWELTAGTHPGNAYGVSGVNTVAPGGQHQIMNGGNDPVVGIPRVNPDGGQFSARIGDGASSGANVAMLKQTYLVDMSNAIFTYSYAVVVEEPGHPLAEQPYFIVRLYDESGNDIPCGSYSVQSTASNPDFINAGNDVLYQNWKTAFAPLTSYIGQNVTIEFRVADCSQSGHYGYAYVDATCRPFGVITSTGGTFICGSDPLTLTAPDGAASYLWNTGETTQSITVTTGGYYEVEMVPVTGVSCSITASVTVGNAPYPVADFTMAPSTVCENDDISFTDNSTVSSGNIEFWQWDFGDGVVTQSANGPITNETDTEGTYENPVHTYGASGNLNVTLTVTSDAGCSATTTHPVTVSPAPLISAGPDQNLCPGDPFTPQGQGGVSYTWDQGLTDGVEIAVGTTTITYAVTGVDAIGCFATDSVTIFIDQVEVPDPGSDQVVCDGESVILSASTDPGYAWDNGVQDGVAFVPSQTTVYTITYTSPNGCQASDDVLVTVNSNPAVWAGNDISVCEGETVVLTGSGAVSYEWDNGIVDGQSFVPDRSGTYTVIGTDQNGCQNTDDVYLNWVATPQVDFIADTLDGCIPIHVTYTASTTGAIASCLWNFGDGSTSTQCGDISHTYSAQGCYTVSYSVATAEGCANEITKNDYICSYPNPTADFTPTPNILTTLDWESEMINESSGAVSYLWDFGDESPTSTEISPTHEFPTNYGGDYLVTLIAYSEDGCADTISQLVVVNEVILYYVPNTFTPDNDEFNEVFKPVFSQGYDPYNYNLLIFNRWGEVLFESNDAEFGWDGTYGGKIVEDGTYVWKITYKVKDIDKRHIISGHVTLIR